MTTEQKVDEVKPVGIEHRLEKRTDLIDVYQLTEVINYGKGVSTKWMHFTGNMLKELHRAIGEVLNGFGHNDNPDR